MNNYNCSFPQPSPFKSILNEYCIFEENSSFYLRCIIICLYVVFILLNFWLLVRSRMKAKRMTQVKHINRGTFGDI